MKETANKKEIIKRLNQAFKNGDLELSEDQGSYELLKLINALDCMSYKDVNRASETLSPIVGVSDD